MAEHKDCYFILGTYDFYLVNKQMAVFNLKKMGGSEHADDFVRSNGFGESIPYRKNKNGDYVDKHGKQVYSPFRDYAGVGSEGPTISDMISDMPSAISSRYSRDWLYGIDSINHDDDDVINHGLFVPIPLGQLDKLYAAVRSKFSQQMDDIYATEMKVGGDNSYLDGHFERYCDQLPCDVLKKHIESYVRRQGIWVLAQGDPMNPEKIRVDKAWIVVGGPDIFMTLK